MKIRVTTAEYEYMGLPKGLETCAYTEGDTGVTFVHKGKVWHLDGEEYEADHDVRATRLQAKPIKSDGGSSSYYDFKVPNHYLELIDNSGIIKTEYLIDIIFSNDFNFACAFKALVRAKGITDGAGKEGNSLDYELNKMDYYEGKIKEKYRWRNE